MLKVTASLTLKVAGIASVKDVFRRPRGEVKQAMDEAGKIYVTFVLREFDKNSRNGGKWKKLNPKTSERKKSSAILVDKRVLRTGLATSIFIKIQVNPRVAVVAKFGGTKRHRAAKMTIADLATIHHMGLGNVPARKILVTPDRATLGRMSKKLVNAARKQLKK